jgi:predicted kinase
MKTLYIVRGLPGSGKSTFANSLGILNHYEADMYHIVDGEYRFDPSKIKNAHEWCKQSAKGAMECGADVVVSNTFTRKWEYEQYIELAEKYGYTYFILTMNGDYGSIHSVPDDVIDAMKERFEY